MQTINLLDVKIDNLTLVSAVKKLLQMSADKKVTSHCAFINADCLNISYDNDSYRALLNDCDLVFGDGSGVRYAARFLKQPIVDNVNGTDLFPLLCEAARDAGQSIYLLGGRPGIAAAAAERAQRRYPGLSIAGHQQGFQDEWDQVIADINASGADILLVAMGAPRQELWIEEHKGQLDVGLAVGVGGLFDFVARQVGRAPLWIRLLGFEWIVRLANEPRRLMYRYLIGNPLFLYRIWRSRKQTAVTESLEAGNDAERDYRSLGFRFDLWQDFEVLDKVEGKYQRLTEGQNGIRAGLRRQIGRLQRAIRQRRFHVIKRTFDIAGAGTAMLLLSPVFLFTALAIVLENPGPVFYSQARVGRYGRLFQMFKFRSMVVDADKMKSELLDQNESGAGVIFKMKRDPRITRVGRIIRRFSIDELPQLYNVLKGDMTLVGPRPPVPHEVAEYTLEDRQRLDVTPGITCIWQVSGRSDIDFTGQVDLDLQYIHSRSVKRDITLMFKTIPAVLSGKGAY